MIQKDINRERTLQPLILDTHRWLTKQHTGNYNLSYSYFIDNSQHSYVQVMLWVMLQLSENRLFLTYSYICAGGTLHIPAFLIALAWTLSIVLCSYLDQTKSDFMLHWLKMEISTGTTYNRN